MSANMLTLRRLPATYFATCICFLLWGECYRFPLLPLAYVALNLPLALQGLILPLIFGLVYLFRLV